MGAPPGAPDAIAATPRTRANTLTPNTRNMSREHHRHHGRAHGREELTPYAVLASLPMHAHAHPSILVAMPVAADGANAGPAQSSPARGAAGGSNLGSPVQASLSIARSCWRPAFTGHSGPHPARHAPDSREEEQSMSDSKPALASPPLTLSHNALPTSTAAASAFNSTSSALLNHAARLIAAAASSQLALLFSSSLAETEALRGELARFPGQMWTEKRESEKDVKAESKVLRSAVKAVPDAEARADRAECAHVDLAASLRAQFTEVERYEHVCSLRSADAHAAFARLLSTASHAAVGYPGNPTAASSESPHFQHEQREDTLSVPSLSLPYAICAPFSGSSILTGSGAHLAHLRHPLPCDTPAFCRHITLEARPLHSIRLPDKDTDNDRAT
ncbi:hypothetical protein DFH11DRAFT_1730282 [Phellopilus nigrolimitatus]|nr:hypothetical protein DFH11DRAFT_1730282 [Phellopilus nigrolimitatus]